MFGKLNLEVRSFPNFKVKLVHKPIKCKRNKAKSKFSLRPRSYTEFKEYIEITDIFQKAHEKLPQTAIDTLT